MHGGEWFDDSLMVRKLIPSSVSATGRVLFGVEACGDCTRQKSIHYHR